MGQTQNLPQNDQDNLNKMYVLRSDHNGQLQEAGVHSQQKSFTTTYATDWETLSRACSSMSQMSEAAKLLLQEKDKQVTELKERVSMLEEKLEAKEIQLKAQVDKLDKKLEVKDGELIKLRSKVSGSEVQSLKIELTAVTVRLEEKDKQLIEWKTIADGLIKNHASFDEFKSQMRNMSARASADPSPQQSSVNSEDNSVVPPIQTEELNDTEMNGTIYLNEQNSKPLRIQQRNDLAKKNLVLAQFKTVGQIINIETLCQSTNIEKQELAAVVLALEQNNLVGYDEQSGEIQLFIKLNVDITQQLTGAKSMQKQAEVQIKDEDLSLLRIKQNRHLVSNFFDEILVKYNNPCFRLTEGFKQNSELFNDGIELSHPCIVDEKVNKEFKGILDRTMRQASTRKITNILSKWATGKQWISFELSSGYIDHAFFDNIFLLLETFKRFAFEHLKLSQEDLQNVHVSQFDVTMNINGTFCSFSFDADYQLLKEKLLILFQNDRVQEYFMGKQLSLNNGDNSMNTCMQYELKCLKPGSSKEKVLLMKPKIYGKTLDLIQKEAVGKSIGTKISHLIGADLNMDKQSYDQTQKAWKNGMGRGELSNRFSKWRSFEHELGTTEGQTKFIEFHRFLFQQLLDILNSPELQEKIAWKIDTTNLLKQVSQLKHNICVIGPDSATLVLADNKSLNRNVSSFIGVRRALKVAKKVKANHDEFKNFLKKNASCGADISVFRHNSDKSLGKIKKRGNWFVPPGVFRQSQYNPCMPPSFRCITTDEELKQIQLDGFNEVVKANAELGAIADIDLEKEVQIRQVIINKRVETAKQAQIKKRDLKVFDKALCKKAKENSRSNRDEDMDYFATYYKEMCSKLSFSAFKRVADHPWRVQQLMKDDIKTKKIKYFIENTKKLARIIKE